MESTVLNILKNLNPPQDVEKLGEIVSLVLSSCPRLDHQYFIKWLMKSMEEKESRKCFKRLLVGFTNPFSFDLNASSGWIILHYTRNSHTPSGCEDITKVPCVFMISKTSMVDEGKVDDTIAADIRVGDEIKIMSLPNVWWLVHEVRPNRNSILAIRIKESSHECRIKGREYQEIYPIQLMGCLIRRPALCLCDNHFPDPCTCNDENKRWCFFQFPRVDPYDALEKLQLMSESESRHSDFFGISGRGGQTKSGSSEDDHLKKMQRGAFVQAWLSRKAHLMEASKIMDRIHSSVSLCRPHWMTIGKILRVVSAGGKDLFNIWCQWAARCDSTKYTKEESLAIWTAFRPPTNCDDRDIMRAREFLYHRRALLYSQESDYHSGMVGVDNLPIVDEHHVPLRDIYYDPISRAVIDDAEIVLHHAFLEYWSDCDHTLESAASGSATRRHAWGSGHSKNRFIQVPCAYYTVDTESYLRSSERLDGQRSPLPEPQFEEMGTCAARVHPGDLICIAGSSYQYPHTKDLHTVSNQQWYVVHRVDLLFARVLVQKCHPPPLQFLEPSDEIRRRRVDTKHHWIAMSKLWRVTVCSKTPAPDRLTSLVETRFIRYHMFVTPLPDPAAALAILKSYEATAPNQFVGACTKDGTVKSHPVCPVTLSGDGPAQTTPLCLVVLDSSSVSISLTWGRAMNSDALISNLLAAADGLDMQKGVGIVDIAVRTSHDKEVSAWIEVYRGNGSGCRIDNLEPSTCYHIRLRTLLSVAARDENVQHHTTFCPQGGAVYIKASTSAAEEGGNS